MLSWVQTHVALHMSGIYLFDHLGNFLLNVMQEASQVSEGCMATPKLLGPFGKCAHTDPPPFFSWPIFAGALGYRLLLMGKVSVDNPFRGLWF